MNKNLLKTIIFVLIFCILMYFLVNFLWLDNHIMSYVYNEQENTIDVAYIGASTVYCSFNTTLAYKQYGYTTWNLSSGSQPFTATKYLMKEIRKTQNPSLYVIDLGKVAYGLDVPGADIRKVTDAMKWSDNRTEAINGMLKYTSIDKKDYVNYKYSFLLYHNRWKDINENNFIGNPNVFKGFTLAKDTVKIEPQTKYVWTDEKDELQEENKEVLNDLIGYIKSNNLDALFVVPKKKFLVNDAKKMNEAIEIIEEKGFKVINFNKVEDIGLDWSKDFKDFEHLNIYGATKYTLYFAKYLHENYDLPNHKGDEKYASWDSEYDRMKNEYRVWTKNDYEDLVSQT